MFATHFAICLLSIGPPDPTRVIDDGRTPPDSRLERPRNLDDYHPWSPPADAGSWEKRGRFLRTQLLVSQGLWPMPKRGPVQAVVHGKLDRGDYTIEKVLLHTRVGVYLAGNLYRPTKFTGKRPVVLCPHGHWPNGRFYDAGQSAAGDLKSGGESFPVNAKHPLQALPAQLAKFGYIAFAYDMIGYADSDWHGHPRSTMGLFNGGFEDAESLLRLQSFMGLQTWNSLRALDWIASLEDVDASKIAVTGGSGGGTQTFMLCALDERPLVSFPTVMVSTGMQGGCVCENAPLLRVGTTNVEIAALHAPKPLGMTGANDWTKEIETKGLPELRKIYSVLGAPDAVAAWCRPEFPHNYNQVSRERLYGWLALHFADAAGATEGSAVRATKQALKQQPKETPLTASSNAELSVFDAGHPRPRDEYSLPKLKATMRRECDAEQIAMRPKTAEDLKRYRGIIGPALSAMMVDELPAADQVEVQNRGPTTVGDWVIEKYVLGRKQAPVLYGREAIPVAVFRGPGSGDACLVWVDADGKSALWNQAAGEPTPTLARLAKAGWTVIAPDVFLTGEFQAATHSTPNPAIDPRYAGYNHCYNRSILANRVHDVLTTTVFARKLFPAKPPSLAGFGAAGPWVLLAKALAGEAVDRTAADLGGWRFADVKDPNDPRLVPGGKKYCDLPGLTVLCSPDPLFLSDGAQLPAGDRSLLQNAYGLAGKPAALVLGNGRESALLWLTKP